MLNIIPHDDQNQELRIRRLFMASATYGMWMLMIGYCYYHGWFRVSQPMMLLVFTMVIVHNASLYFIFRTGINKKFHDPSLTMFQMLVGTFVAMLVAYYTDRVRGIVLLLYLVVFIFGVFRLQLRQFIILALYALSGYGYVIVLLLANHPEKIDLQEEVLYWAVLATVLAWFAAIGSYINHLREKLVKTNAELSQANERIRLSAISDDLTGVSNRRHMMKILQREKAVADRGGLCFSLCIIDLDDFKHVNDTFGHQAGDMVLKTLVNVLKESIREQDYIARYGGEEFVIILSYPTIEDSLICAERLKQTASDLKYPGMPEGFRVTISIGLAKYTPKESIDALIGRADTALYQAKIMGKNRIVVELPLLTAVKKEEATGS